MHTSISVDFNEVSVNGSRKNICLLRFKRNAKLQRSLRTEQSIEISCAAAFNCK